jgi:hypothetical protein
MRRGWDGSGRYYGGGVAEASRSYHGFATAPAFALFGNGKFLKRALMYFKKAIVADMCLDWRILSPMRREGWRRRHVEGCDIT